MKNSPMGRLTLRDAGKSILLAFITAVITGVTQTLSTGALPHTLDQWTTIGATAATATGSYIVKNWLTNSSDQFLVKEAKDIQNKMADKANDFINR